MQPAPLWTDILIWVLVIISVSFALYARRHEHLRAPWSQVVRSRTALGALTVLVFFVAVGLLDSLHFHPRIEGSKAGEAQYSAEILSVFDLIVEPLREQREKTYSAPFATHLFTKETIELPGGGTRRDYPRLRYGGAHLDDPEAQRGGDILGTFVTGLGYGLGSWLLLLALMAALDRSGATFTERVGMRLRAGRGAPWHVAWWTLLVMLLLVFATAELATKYHVLGTDKVGKDVLYQSLKSIRTGLVIGTLTTLVMLPAAILLGIMAGYFKGWVDDLIQYVYTTLNSIPSVLLIAAAVLMMHIYMNNNADDFNSVTERADLRLLFLCIILGITSWTGLCRLLRGESFKLRELDYVQAAHAFGVPHFRVLTRHVLPNVMHIVMISVVIDFSGLVLAEAVLSYINIGVDPSTDSWGNMINGARLELAREPVVWWSLVAAFVFMFTLVLAANLFADAVRDAFDPRLRNTL